MILWRVLLIFLLSTLFPALVAAGPFVSDNVVIKTYVVSGDSLKQLKNQMRQNGPDGYWGYTRYNWTWSSGCNMRFEATITLPKLSVRSRLDANELAEWDRMVAALKSHEMGHVEIGRSWAAAIKAGGCSNAAVARADRAWQDKDVAYDRRTDHGKRNGVVLGR